MEMMSRCLVILLLTALNVVLPAVIPQQNDVIAMDGISDVNRHIDQSDIIEIDEKFEEPEELGNIPEGVQLGLLLKNTRTQWKDGIVYFRISDEYNNQQKQMIRAAVKDIEAGTCIRFRELSRDEQNIHYIYVINGSGCWSFVGKSRGNYQQLSLKIPGCIRTSIITHEFIHSLGVFHEQSRPDRGQYVDIHPENMVKDALSQFEKKTGVINSLGVPYDGQSIMHYGRWAFSNQKGPTITWKKDFNQPLGGKVMSEMDIKQINLLYNCQNSPKPTTSTTTPSPPPTTTTTTTPPPPTTTSPPPSTTTTTTTTTSTTSTTVARITTRSQICIDSLWCKYVRDPSTSCDTKFIRDNCKSMCNACLQTPQPTTSTTTQQPEIKGCNDVSDRCQYRFKNCAMDIYKRRCRKACGLCSKPLPTDCQLRTDIDRDCFIIVQNGCRNISIERKQRCALSCCLRKE